MSSASWTASTGDGGDVESWRTGARWCCRIHRVAELRPSNNWSAWVREKCRWHHRRDPAGSSPRIPLGESSAEVRRMISDHSGSSSSIYGGRGVEGQPLRCGLRPPPSPPIPATTSRAYRGRSGADARGQVTEARRGGDVLGPGVPSGDRPDRSSRLRVVGLVRGRERGSGYLGRHTEHAGAFGSGPAGGRTVRPRMSAAARAARKTCAESKTSAAGLGHVVVPLMRCPAAVLRG